MIHAQLHDLVMIAFCDRPTYNTNKLSIYANAETCQHRFSHTQEVTLAEYLFSLTIQFESQATNLHKSG